MPVITESTVRGGWGGGGWGEDGGRRGEEGELRRWTRSGLPTDDFELESSRSQILCLNFLSLPLTWKNLAKDVMPTTEDQAIWCR